MASLRAFFCCFICCFAFFRRVLLLCLSRECCKTKKNSRKLRPQKTFCAGFLGFHKIAQKIFFLMPFDGIMKIFMYSGWGGESIELINSIIIFYLQSLRARRFCLLMLSANIRSFYLNQFILMFDKWFLIRKCHRSRKNRARVSGSYVMCYTTKYLLQILSFLYQIFNFQLLS